MAIETKQLHALSKIYNEAVYGKSPEQIEASRRKKNDLAGAPLTVTNADKKANTKAYQNYKAGVKGYKAADHMKEEEKKAKKDYDGDGKVESGKDEYFGSKDKAIKKAMGKKSPEAIEASRRKKDDLAGAPLKNEETDNYVEAYVALLNKTNKGIAEGDYHSGQGEKVVARTKKYMDKKGQKGAPGLDAMKARTAEHKAKRGVKSEGYQRNPEGSIKDRFKSTQTDPSKDNFTGIGNSIKDIMKQNAAMKKAAAKKTKKESLSNWRQDLKEIPDYEEIPASAKKRNEKIEEKDNIKNEIKINPEMKEEAQIISEKEVNVKDTRRTVDAIRAYDKSKDASRDATYDSDEGKKGKAKKEKEYAAKERGEIDKDDPNWKKRKYHTGIHGESYEATKTKEVMGALKKRDLKTSVKKKIAADIVKRKGDTSKSDDRYAYESKLWDEVAENLTQLGELNDADFRVEGYQRNPEADPRSARQRRMDDPDRGINSQAFRDFMAAQQRPAKKKPVAKKKDSK